MKKGFKIFAVIAAIVAALAVGMCFTGCSNIGGNGSESGENGGAVVDYSGVYKFSKLEMRIYGSYGGQTMDSTTTVTVGQDGTSENDIVITLKKDGTATATYDDPDFVLGTTEEEMTWSVEGNTLNLLDGDGKNIAEVASKETGIASAKFEVAEGRIVLKVRAVVEGINTDFGYYLEKQVEKK